MEAHVRRAGLSATIAALAIAIPLVLPQSTAASNVGPDTTCTSPDPCLEWDNTAKGSGVIGTSAKGNGVVGQTKAGSTTRHAGVEGIDVAGSNFKNYGVLGTSKLGAGVAGFAGNIVTTEPPGDGVFGASGLLNGVHGEVQGNHTGPAYGVYGEDLTADSEAAGVRGASSTGSGVSGTSSEGNGAQGISLSGIASGVYGENDASGGFGLAGRNVADGVGVLADNPISTATFPALLVHQAHGDGCPCQEVIVNNSDGNDPMTLDTDGNMVLMGTLTQNGVLRVATPTNTGRKVVTYAPRETQSTVEDFGEAQLVDGQAVVQLDPTFASSIDTRSPYLVFVTPDGATHGSLYVASKTPTGFTVRENGGGRSSVVFDYRIVAKPYRDASPRTPAYAPPRHARIVLPKAWHER